MQRLWLALIGWTCSGSLAVGGLDYPTLAGWLLPVTVGLLVWGLWTRSKPAPPRSLLDFSRSKARRYAAEAPGHVTLADVAGLPTAKAELQEVVDFLRQPERFTALGGRLPKGFLLVGPPGTGKTLLARAVAGEAGVPFFALAGSEFVELFVGVGAGRVRSLFEQARAQKPCVVFIDELDAVGKARSGHPLAANDERDHTLNQLLAEMDGFDSAGGVLVLAATNRAEILDPALLRPGRFDRRIHVEAPDLVGREAILALHAARIPLAPDVDLARLARRTTGFVGADLAQLVNEGALLAARAGQGAMRACDLDQALDRVVTGMAMPHLVLQPEERLRISLHEAGHALVASLLPGADPVERVSLVPRSQGSLGHTWQVPEADRYLHTRSQLLVRLAVLMAGRAAEILVLGEPSTGASDDVQRATGLARQLVCHFGMSEALGPQALSVADPMAGRACSEATARRIDAEVQAMLEGAAARAAGLLAEHVGPLSTVARWLRAREQVDGAEIRALLAAAPPGESPPEARSDHWPRAC